MFVLILKEISNFEIKLYKIIEELLGILNILIILFILNLLRKFNNCFSKLNIFIVYIN